MAIEKLSSGCMSFPANADLSACQYRVVCIQSDGSVDLPKTAVTAIPIGILQNAPKAGQEAVVALCGSGFISKAWADAALANGAIVALQWADDVGNSGRVKAAATTQIVIGQVVFPSGAQDDLCSVLLAPMPIKA